MNIDKSSDKRIQEECYICGKLCEPSRILSHIRSHYNFMVYECEECGNRFASKKSLRQHSLTHQTHYICEVCNRKFGDPSRLVVHRCIDAKEKKYFCDTCGKGFLHKSRLTRHIAGHLEEKSVASNASSTHRKLTDENILIVQQNEENSVDSPKNLDNIYLCDLCPRTFSTKRNLRRHRFHHTKDWPFTCKYCRKKFQLEDDFTAHVSTHTDKTHKCEWCGRTFNKKSNMHKHILIHKRKENEKSVPKVKKEKFFICNLCFKNYSSKRNLERHQLLHTNKKPYTCKICNKSYASISYLKDHSLYHTNEKLFKCNECGKSYYNNRLLGKHVRRHRDPSIFCSVCGKGFYETVEYDRHFAIHANIKPYICDICHKGFAMLMHLERHYIWHTKVTTKNKDGADVDNEDIINDNSEQDNEKEDADFDSDVDNEDIINDNSEQDNEKEDADFDSDVDNEDVLIENSKQDNEKEDSDFDDLQVTSENSDEEYGENFPIENSDEDSEKDYAGDVHVSDIHVASKNNIQELSGDVLVDSDESEERETKINFSELFTPVIYSCNVCKVKFSDEITLREHKYSDLKCCACFKRFENEEILLEHQKIHDLSTFNKPVVCFLKKS